MKTDQKRSWKQILGMAAVAAIAMFGMAGTGEAGDSTQAGVKTTVSSTFDSSLDSGTLSGSVTLEQVKENEIAIPEVCNEGSNPGTDSACSQGQSVIVYVEQHKRNGTKFEWETVSNSNKYGPVLLGGVLEVYCCTGPASWHVTTYRYASFCTLNVDNKANAIRVVAQVFVQNAQGNKGKWLLGRSLGLPNPCKQ